MMRLHKLLLINVLIIMVGTGCSSFSMVRTKGKNEPSKTQYSFRDSKATQKRLEEQNALGLAQQRLRVGDVNVAEKEAKRALKINPESSDAHTLLAIIDDRRSENAAAGTHYRLAAELAPQNGSALNNYGAWLCANGYEAEALVWFDRALAEPSYTTPASALANAGGCALQTGQYERAERDLRKALSLDPTNAYALFSMARDTYRKAQYMDARAFIERRLSAAPASADVLQLAADIEFQLGNRAAAEGYLNRLQSEFPESALKNIGDGAKS